ncbi:hypothetical protein M9458_011564, partial [Cirrhinus mrigala]
DSRSPIYPLCNSGQLSLEYVRDEAHEVAEQLMNLTSSSYQDILRKGNFSQREASGTSEFNPEHRCTVGQHRAVDEKITQALANLHFLGWDSQVGQEKQ